MPIWKSDFWSRAEQSLAVRFKRGSSGDRAEDASIMTSSGRVGWRGDSRPARFASSVWFGFVWFCSALQQPTTTLIVHSLLDCELEYQIESKLKRETSQLGWMDGWLIVAQKHSTRGY